MALLEHLMKIYGPLMTLEQLGCIMHRSPEGLRISLRGRSAFAQATNAARVRLGRRIYFSTPKIAVIVGLPQSEEVVGNRRHSD